MILAHVLLSSAMMHSIFGYTFESILAAQAGGGSAALKPQGEVNAGATVAMGAANVPAPSNGEQAFLGRRIKAWWSFRGKEYLTEGVVRFVNATQTAGCFRLMVERADGTDQRVYVGDKNWRIQLES